MLSLQFQWMVMVLCMFACFIARLSNFFHEIYFCCCWWWWWWFQWFSRLLALVYHDIVLHFNERKLKWCKIFVCIYIDGCTCTMQWLNLKFPFNQPKCTFGIGFSVSLSSRIFCNIFEVNHWIGFLLVVCMLFFEKKNYVRGLTDFKFFRQKFFKYFCKK